MQFIDLAAQQKRIRKQIEANLKQVLDHGQYVMGPEVAQLERALAAYVDVRTCRGLFLRDGRPAAGVDGPGDRAWRRRVHLAVHLYRHGRGGQHAGGDAGLRGHRACDLQPGPSAPRTRGAMGPERPPNPQGDHRRGPVRSAGGLRADPRHRGSARAVCHRGRGPVLRSRNRRKTGPAALQTWGARLFFRPSPLAATATAACVSPTTTFWPKP